MDLPKDWSLGQHRACVLGDLRFPILTNVGRPPPGRYLARTPENLRGKEREASAPWRDGMGAPLAGVRVGVHSR